MAATFALPQELAVVDRLRLAGRVAVISGAGSAGAPGIGAAIAWLFAKQGAGIGVLDISADRADATVKAIATEGGQAIALVADLREANACEAALAQTRRAFGPVSVLVNNASIVRPGDVSSIEDAAWRETIDTTLSGTLNLTRAASADLRTTHGAVINISSIAASHAFGAIAYAAC